MPDTWKPLPAVVRWSEISEKWSRQTGVPVPLILAFIHQESGGRENVTRYEPEYERTYVLRNRKNLAIAKSCGLATRDVATSYGLMQLMFPLAYGYGARSKADALDPDKNIRYGAAHIGALLKQATGIAGIIDARAIRAAAGKYNGAGENSAYARNVAALYERYNRWWRCE